MNYKGSQVVIFNDEHRTSNVQHRTSNGKRWRDKITLNGETGTFEPKFLLKKMNIEY